MSNPKTVSEHLPYVVSIDFWQYKVEVDILANVLHVLH